jgi:hypothetical protein
MIRPIIAPSAMMVAMWPRVAPMPSSMVFTRSAAGTPATSATTMLTTTRATKGWTLALRMSSSRATTPAKAMVSRAVWLIVPLPHRTWETGR